VCVAEALFANGRVRVDFAVGTNFSVMTDVDKGMNHGARADLRFNFDHDM
jgi:hypothetical protein